MEETGKPWRASAEVQDPVMSEHAWPPWRQEAEQDVKEDVQVQAREGPTT